MGGRGTLFAVPRPVTRQKMLTHYKRDSVRGGGTLHAVPRYVIRQKLLTHYKRG